MKILIADDHALFRDGLGMRLEQLYPNMIILQVLPPSAKKPRIPDLWLSPHQKISEIFVRP